LAVAYSIEIVDGKDSLTTRVQIMSNDKSIAKTTATEPQRATSDQKPGGAHVSATVPVIVAASPDVDGPIKNAATPISKTPTADMTGSEGKSDTSASPPANAEKKAKVPTKMEVASAVYARMSRQKDMTRKQIVEQFVMEAKLSAAGASTYYQLIKAKLG
jgi:hypothetical protein